jgi:predicted phosphodiesterase
LKIRIVSDLHLDVCHMTQRPDEGADFAFISGDSCNGRSVDTIAPVLEHIFPEPHIFIITGNHEGYRQPDYESMQARLALSCSGTRVRLLERTRADVGGFAILGATLWTDFELFGSHRREDAMSASAAFMMDYRVIGRDGTIITPDDTLSWHLRDRAWIESELAACKASSTPAIVMTHHAPSRASLAPKYALDLSSAGFVSDLPSTSFDGARLWIHGHTHTSFDYMVGNCRVICNPRGYTTTPDFSTENPLFNPDFIIDIQP